MPALNGCATRPVRRAVRPEEIRGHEDGWALTSGLERERLRLQRQRDALRWLACAGRSRPSIASALA